MTHRESREHRKTANELDACSDLIHFITGALVGVLMWWLDGRKRLSVDEVNAYLRKQAMVKGVAFS